MSGVSLVGKTLQGHYRITAKLGEGGFGETYLAIDTSKFNRTCVVKRLKPQNQSTFQWVQHAFEQEAQMLETLGRHPQIPDLLAYFLENQEFFLVQEFIDGNDLRTEFIPGRQWSENAVLFLLRDILEVLEFVHQRGVIHRDIKPENLILQKPDNKVVLIDFGAVKQVSTQVFNTNGQVIATAVVGTEGYMPVEQLRGHPMLCSDIYAVGMIGIEALTGILPQQLDIDPSTLEVIWRERLQVPVSDNLANILDTMVRYFPNNRYKSASEALESVRYLTRTVRRTSTTTQTQTSSQTPIKYAGFSTRFVADIIDKTILIISSFSLDFITNGAAKNDELWGRVLVYYIILGFIYSTVMESSPKQGTVGKILLGIAVTDNNGNRLSFEQSAKRYFCKLLSYLTIFIGFFMAGFTSKKQTIHDMASGSLVIRKQ
ncbi:protein kinase domain-containing protein [Nostoc sp.]|uniref:protein kinase domain-containing protein n=1 Tax=Nostoc sp. TaxID=1180 RepID=UPI002FF86B40